MRLSGVVLALVALPACYESHAVEVLPDGRVVDVDAGGVSVGVDAGGRVDLSVGVDAAPSVEAGGLLCGATGIDLRGATACSTLTISSFPLTCSFAGEAHNATFLFVIPPSSGQVFVELDWFDPHNGRIGPVSDCEMCNAGGAASLSPGPGGAGVGPFSLPAEGGLVMLSVEPETSATAMICPG